MKAMKAMLAVEEMKATKKTQKAASGTRAGPCMRGTPRALPQRRSELAALQNPVRDYRLGMQRMRETIRKELVAQHSVSERMWAQHAAHARRKTKKLDAPHSVIERALARHAALD
jgi:hypothetical protein